MTIRMGIVITVATLSGSYALGQGACAFVRAVDRHEVENSRQIHEREDTEPDAVTCRSAGGIVIRSAWDRHIIDCKIVTNSTKQQAR